MDRYLILEQITNRSEATMRKSNLAKLGSTSVLLLSLLGCATDKVIESVTLAEKPSPGFRPGPVYFLPRALVEVQVVRTVSEQGEITDAFTIGPLEYVADTSRVFRINYDPNAFSDDKIVVETDSTGLIQAVNTTLESKAVDFTKKFQEFVSAATPTVGRSFAEVRPKAFALKIRIDPALQTDRERASKKVKALTDDLTLEIVQLSTAYTIDKEVEKKPSVWVPLPSTYRFSLSRGPEVIGESIVTVPDPLNAVGMNISRAAFTKAETKLTGTNGYLTKYDYSKGSEAVGAASLPVEAAKAIVSIPAALFQFKLAKVTDDQALADAQKELLGSQAALAKADANAGVVGDIEDLNAQVALLNAQKGVLDAQTALLKAQEAAKNNAEDQP
jgi:hypothetical protein